MHSWLQASIGAIRLARRERAERVEQGAVFVFGSDDDKQIAEVTLGGIATEGLEQTTMQARAVPGLYCIGEAVDITGWLGGYNFQWAWSSGWAAGQDC